MRRGTIVWQTMRVLQHLVVGATTIVLLVVVVAVVVGPVDALAAQPPPPPPLRAAALVTTWLRQARPQRPPARPPPVVEPMTVDPAASTAALAPPPEHSAAAVKPRTTTSRCPGALLVRIQATVAADLPAVAAFLTTPAVPKDEPAWMSRINQLWAKADVEALLRRRLHALLLGKRAAVRVRTLATATAVDDNGSSSKNLPAVAAAEHQQQQQQRLLQVWWSTSDAVRRQIAMAADETGEDTVWRHHHMALTPESPRWLYHVQMSATTTAAATTTTAKSARRVVGFCEIAMLSNPTFSNATAYPLLDGDGDDTDCIITVADGQTDRSSSSSSVYCHFSPAIANLAVAPDARRRGVAGRLLRAAERYVAAQWDGATTLGLFVEQANAAAIALYETHGYAIVTAASGGGGGRGDMWYMRKSLRRRRHQQQSQCAATAAAANATTTDADQ